MPTFEVDVEGKTYEVDAPDTNTAWAWAYTTHRQQFGMKPAAPPEKTGMLRAAADIPVQVGRGVAVGVKALSDVFGADNPVSRAASGVEDFLGGLLSAQAKNDQAEIARIMKEAQDKGVGDQVSAAVKAFATAPVDMLSQALGTAVPVIAGGLAGSVARLGAMGVGAIGTGVGAAMGAGTVKGQIYDAVKQELLENKVPEAEAEKRAQEAQAYGGKNLDQILMGAGIGAAEAAFGAERILTGLLRKGAVKPSALPAKYRIPAAAGMEAVPEMAQAAQEQAAQNIALQREGYDVPTMRGVVGQAALEGLAGAGLGAITGAVQRTEAAKPGAEPPKPQAPSEPQQAEAEAPKPVAGEAGIVRPEEETPISREVAKEAVPEVAPPAPAEIQPIAEEAAVEPPPAEPIAAPAAEPVAEPVAPIEPIEAKRGAETRIIAGEEKIPAQWEVVEADSVKAAMTEGKTQPRDRQRAVSNAQIMSIAQNPDFDRLSDTSQTMDYGAPTLTQDGAIVGGNGRFEGVNLSYDTEAGQRYKQSLLENAERLGLDREQVGAMQKPILVRRITQPADTRKLAIQSNIVAGLELSDMEQAALDAERMAGLDRLEISEAGDIPITSRNMDVLRSAFKDYTTEEMGKMMSAEGGLSQAGLRRVRNAILYKAYGKTDTLARLVESPDPDLKNVGTALMRASGGMSQMMDAIRSGAIPAEYDIIEDLTGAIETLSSLRASGTKVQDFLAQSEMFGDGISGSARSILRFMDNNLRSAASITKYLNDYAQSVLSAESATGGLFGETQLPTKQETLERAAQKYEAQRAATKAQRTLEEQPAGEVRPEGRVQPEGEGRAAGSDEEAAKVSEQQAKDAGTPANVTEAMDEYAFGKQMGAKQVTGIKQKGEKASITIELRQKPNKELAISVAEGDVYGVINQLVASQNPLIAQIGKLASQRPYFGIGLKSMFPGMPWPAGAAGAYSPRNGIAAVLKKYADREHVVAHEIVHYLTYDAINNPTEDQKPVIQRLQKLFDHVKKNIGVENQKLYGLANLDEFVAEANSNVNFQYKLRQIKYQNQTAWGAFTKYVAQLLGLGNDTALTEIIALTEELASPESRTTVAPPGVVLAMKPDEETYRGEIGKEKPPTPTTAGQQALDTINQLGMGVKEPEGNLYEQTKKKLQAMGENPSLTIQEAKKKFGEWMDWFETKTFSADAKFEADVRRGLKEDMAGMETLIGTMLSVSQSGAVHADAVATQAVLNGRAEYDPETQKWVAVEDKNNITELSRQIEAIADKYGLTKEEAQRVAHTYFVAKNYNGILERNKKTQAQIDSLKEEGKKEEADDLKDTLIFVTPDQKALVEPGLELINQIPELGKMVETWTNIRQNFVKTLVDSYLWSPEYATAMLDNIDYVPFYREEQVQEEEGPQQMIRGLQVKSKEHKLKGSASPVNDVFDNMARWMQYAMNRAIRNHKALQMVDVATEMKVGDRMMAKKVSEPKRGMNVARVWRGGKQEFYDMADPLYVGAFQSLGAVSIPSIKFFTDISNILRKTVVMYPLFSIGQLTQDSVAAIFASGLKPQHAFKIPFLAVQEFIKTMKGWSTTHDELVKYGVVGVRDFNATVARQDAEITAGIKAPRGAWGKINYMLERIAMSADNAVRQATYIAATDAGLSKAESLEKAFEIINFRRRGSSKLLNLMGQTVPFFYAYLSAQRVAYKTLTGVGISPTERKAALETLAQTTAAVMALSFLYAMANGDDEEYKKTPATVRDRSLIIPGSGGVRIPLRPDFFLFPKVIAEHTYQLITDEGYSDGAKFRKSMADLFANATLSPNAVPQLIKPSFEAAINYSFFEGKPIIGFFEQNKEAGRQFSESTSEFAKMLGQFGASPQMVDHLVRGYFGSVGGLALWGTNFFIEGEPGVPRPELTAQDMLTTMPGVGAFKQKPTENALKVDFYELRDAIAKAKNTYDDMKVRSPEGLEAFLQDEKNLARLAMDKQVTKVGDHLSKIRRAIQQVAAAPAERMSASEKQERIKELRDIEMELLKAVDVKAMRAQAKL